jgi:fumarate hydratase subunit beta
MSEPIRIETPLSDEDVERLKVGDRVLINGVIYTGRDAAHKRLLDLIEKGEELPFDIAGQIIYYVGPTPARPGKPTGSAGPTSSYRMDPYSPKLMEKGLRGMIGKGMRSRDVIDAMRKFKAIYMAAVGGAGIWDRRR